MARDTTRANNPHWKGGRVLTGSNRRQYWMVIAPDGHPGPLCCKMYVLEHRHVMEQALGRFLRPDEIVHHVNGDSLDNRIDNLELTTRATHLEHHRAELYAARDEMYAARTECRNGHPLPENLVWRTRPGGAIFRDCKACRCEQSARQRAKRATI